MATAWITDPPIPSEELRKAKIPGLSQHLDDEGEDYAWTDGKNYMWVYEASGNAVYQVMGANEVQGIQRAISKQFKVKWISEHDEGFWDEDDLEESEEQIQNENGKFDGRLSMNFYQIACRIAGDVIPIEQHKKYKQKGPIYVTPEKPNFSYKSISPDPELEYLDYDDDTLEAISHIKQLADALSKGWIGFEWFTELIKPEISKAGW